MPELPEVETTKNGIESHLLGQTVDSVIIRQGSLRQPVPKELPLLLKGRTINSVSRRAKYLLIKFHHGTVLIHLGMSGSLRVLAEDVSPTNHDHVDIILSNQRCLRYRDPRRFGTLTWTDEDPYRHPLLSSLGLEPLEREFDGEYLYRQSRNRTMPVKSMIMDSHVVVGIGNIYANEALFRAKINPKQRAGRISKQRYYRLADSIRDVLQEAISQGGTTLRDFVNEIGRPGYFQQNLQVYGRAGESCRRCSGTIRTIRLNQRSTFYCSRCQR